MSKVANTYWNKTNGSLQRPKDRSGARKSGKAATPQWFIFTVIVSVTFILCLAINFRAFSELREQSIENTELNAEIEKLTTETIVLQEEIKNLNDDPKTIAREARKIGMSRPNEKILVPIY
ncbi:MAG: septum formation initiator family protein [Acidobacteria bacterium]|nr:septum formation initiator family protein [Acidobacteriota bacterium]